MALDLGRVRRRVRRLYGIPRSTQADLGMDPQPDPSLSIGEPIQPPVDPETGAADPFAQYVGLDPQHGQLFAPEHAPTMSGPHAGARHPELEHVLDALALGAVGADVAPEPRNAGESFVAGLARGYGGARVGAMQQSEAYQERQRRLAAARDAANLEATRRYHERNVKRFDAAAQDLRASKRERQRFEETHQKVTAPDGTEKWAPVTATPPESRADRVARIRDEARARAEGSRYGQDVAGEDSGTANEIASAIENGLQPPITTGLYRYAAAVRGALAKRGYDLTKAQLDWKATERWTASANSTQQLRLRQSAETAYESLDVIDELSRKLSKLMPRSSVAGLNRAALAIAKNSPGEAGLVARQLEAQITDVVSELGNVYMGGNSPTDHALQLASKNLSANWSRDQLRSATDLARKNLRIRLNSIGTASATPAPAPRGPGASPYPQDDPFGPFRVQP